MLEECAAFQVATFVTRSADETHHLGETLGKRLRRGDLVLLHGELGAGKTTLVQGVARGLGIRGEVLSPTFVLIVEHEIEAAIAENVDKSENVSMLLHLDAYRLENLDERALSDAGVFDFLARDEAAKIIEWPSRIESFLPTPRFEIFLRRASSDENDDDRVLEVREYMLHNN